MSKYPTKLAKDFVVLSFVVVITLLTLLITFAYKTYTSQSASILHSLEVQTARINTVFADAIDYTAQTMWHINQQIAKNGVDDVFINKLLESYRVPNNEIVAYSTLTWADSNHKVTVTSNEGIMPDPGDLSRRDYIGLTVSEPGKIHLGQPVYGVTSKKWAIPAGMGAVDAKGNYLGAVVTGFIISALNKKLEGVVNEPGVNFAIFDKDGILIAASHTMQSSTQDINTFKHKLQANSPGAAKSGVLSTFSPWEQGSQFAYYQAMPKYPYTTITTYDRSLSQQAITQAILSFAVEAGVVGALIILLLYVVRRLLVLPVLNLASTAEQIARGNENVVVPHFHTYEMNLLSNQLEEIHTVKTALSKAHSEVRHINATLEQRVAERTESLQDALNARSDFLNHISHEIRTPVSSVHARSDILMELWEEFKHEELKESIQDIQRNALQVCGLVTSLLDLSKSNAGKMVYDMQPNDIALIAQEVAEECRPLYLQKGLELVVEMRAREPVVLCDRMRIGQVIRNLLSNACRYTAKGKVVLLLENNMMQGEDGKQVRAVVVSVKDEGVGIPEGEKTRIFEAFTQSSRTNTKAGGTGLGLAIARTIITAHHGQIWAENNQATAGSTFLFWVPKEGAQR